MGSLFVTSGPEKKSQDARAKACEALTLGDAPHTLGPPSATIASFRVTVSRSHSFIQELSGKQITRHIF